MKVTVRQGDTLWNYSRWFQVPVELIFSSNPGIDANALQTGQQVAIPGYRTEDYLFQPGDTLWAIAASRGILLETIYAINPGLLPSNLQAGQSIQLPVRVTGMVVNTLRPYDYAAMSGDIGKLVDIYPFIRYSTIGSSVQGTGIPELRIGEGDRRVHMNGSVHANEWITTPVLMLHVNAYVLALTNGTSIRGLHMGPYYEMTTLSVVPMVNPDGVNLVLNGPPEEEPLRSEVLGINEGSTDFSGWKANIRGVDLNDQFPALWELEAERQQQQPAPRDYPGTAPLTEPEAQALAGLTRERDFARVLSFHTQGKVIYWGFQDLQPPESEVLANEFARVSGYTPVETVDSYAGYKDWFIQDWRRPGFTIELGQGVNPLPVAQLDEITEDSLGIFFGSFVQLD